MLVVINNEPKYVVGDTVDVIKCIRKYAAEQGWNKFTVDDMKSTKRVLNDKGDVIDGECIMFVSTT